MSFRNVPSMWWRKFFSQFPMSVWDKSVRPDAAEAVEVFEVLRGLKPAEKKG